MVDYKEYNDYELLYLIAEQNEVACEILYNKYKHVVQLKAKKHLPYANSIGLDYSDLVQEGMIGLKEAIRDFKPDKNVKFSTFANLCIERQISASILSANRQKHRILNESLSLEEQFYNTNKTLKEIIVDKKETNPSEYLIGLETEQETYNKICNLLTPFEKKVFLLKQNDYSYKEIANKLGRSYKSIDSAIQRIKTKLKKNLNI
jgi:RNA polymerase sporulation-specific sigma factor